MRLALLFGALCLVAFSGDAGAQETVRVYVKPANTESLSGVERETLTAAIQAAVVERFKGAGWVPSIVEQPVSGPNTFNVTIGKTEPVISGTALAGRGAGPQQFCECKHTDTAAMVEAARRLVDDAIAEGVAKREPSWLTVQCEPGNVRLLLLEKPEGWLGSELQCGRQKVQDGLYKVRAVADGHHEKVLVVRVALGKQEGLIAKLQPVHVSKVPLYVSAGLLGAGVVLSGVGIFNIATHQDEIGESSDETGRQETFRNRRTRGIVAIGVGAALIGGSVALYFLKAREREPERVWSPTVVGDGPGVSLSGRF